MDQSKRILEHALDASSWTNFYRFFRRCALVYLYVSMVFTTAALTGRMLSFMAPNIHRNLLNSSKHLSPFDSQRSISALLSSKPQTNSIPAKPSINLTFSDSPDLILWKPSYQVRQSSKPPVTLDSNLFLSKAFAQAQSYSSYRDTANLKIVPFYYRASASHEKGNITITTLVTRDRFGVFQKLVERYRGPVSVAIHIPISSAMLDSRNKSPRARIASQEAEALLDALHTMYLSSPLMALLVDVHLVLSPSPHDRYFNAWRNVARLFARTDYIMMLDVDFVPCTDFREHLQNAAADSVKALLQSGDAALVIPAFEYVNHSEGLNQMDFPTDKETLTSLVNASRIASFHRAWAPGHNSTDYDYFLYRSEPGEVYPVTTYQHAYEPYVIMRKDGHPWCDERFVGYGGNKAACLFDLYISGVSFYVLSDDFLLHSSHPYEEEAREQERRYNRKIYADFREEMCLKYLMAFFGEGILDTNKAHNILHECRKIKGMSHIALQVLGAEHSQET